MSQISHFFRCVAHRFQEQVTANLISCVAAGGGLTLAAFSWIAMYGLGLSVGLATVIAVCSGVCLAILCATRMEPQRFPLWSRWLAVMIWLVSVPSWVKLGNMIPLLYSTESLGSTTLQVLSVLPAALGLIGLPVFLVSFAITHSSATQIIRSCWGVFAGMILAGCILIPVLPGDYQLGTLVVVLLFSCTWLMTSPPVTSLVLSFSSQILRSSRQHRSFDREIDSGLRVWLWLTPCLLAGLWCLMSLITRQWAILNTTMLAGPLLIGCFSALSLFTLSGTQRFGRHLRNVPLPFGVLLPLAMACVVTLQEERITHWLMLISSEWPTQWRQEAARLMIVGTFPLTTGLTMGLWLRQSLRRPISKRPTLWMGAVSLAGSSWMVVRCLLHSGMPATTLLWGIGFAGIAVAIFCSGLNRDHLLFRRERWRSLTVFGLTAAVLFSIVNLPRWTGQLPSRLMFNPMVFNQFRKGLSWELLPFVDDARLIQVTQNGGELYSAYDYRGLQTSVRRNGIPLGYVSHDYRVMPQSPPDVLMAVLPTVIHGDVSQLALCHWDCGVTVSSSLEFPIENIDCFDANPLIVEMTYGNQLKNPWAGLNPLEDSRVSLHQVRPELALRTSGRSYDVIISSPHRSATAEGAAEMTAEFYRAAAARLAPAGLFCQRFQHYDHGAAAWTDVLKTLREVFPQVIAIEMLPGETLFIAGESPELEQTDQLAERLQRPQVRRVLSRFGWDWGHVLQLPTITSENSDDLLASLPGEVQSIVAPQQLHSHSHDALRWANKWEEKTAAFASYRTRFIRLADESSQTADIQRRIEEVSVQQQHMAELVDTPWAYRAKLKEFLSMKPRSNVRQVKGERPRQEMHPVDKRRVDYLQALSDAHQTKPASAELIHELNNFNAPYDPLISYFLHHEAAELYSRSPGLDPHSEFYHRLKSIYFGDVRDKSVRNVVAALALLLEQEDLTTSDQERFDQLHGLVQFLLNRWQLRKGYSPRNSNEGLSDLRDSLMVSEQALRELDRLAAVTLYGAEDWQLRKNYIELQLVKPLRSYRGRLIPHHEKQVLKTGLGPTDSDRE